MFQERPQPRTGCILVETLPQDLDHPLLEGLHFGLWQPITELQGQVEDVLPSHNTRCRVTSIDGGVPVFTILGVAMAGIRLPVPTKFRRPAEVLRNVLVAAQDGEIAIVHSTAGKVANGCPWVSRATSYAITAASFRS